MKKLNYIVFFLILIIISVVNVKASGFKIDGERTAYGRHYYDNYLPSGQRKGHFTTFSINGKSAYCIEPNVDTKAGLDNYYKSTTPDHTLTKNTITKLSLIAYYGYGYNNHNSLNYRMATQLLVWETSANDPNYSDRNFRFVNFFETDLKTVRDVSAEYNEILRLVNNAMKVPSFDHTSLNVKLGQKIELVDGNGVLSNGFITDSKSDCGNGKATCEIKGNTLVVTPNTTGSISVAVKKEFTYHGNDAEVFYNNGEYQDLVTAGRNPDIYDEVKLNVIGGSVEINKKDGETNVAQGSASLENAVFGIYTTNGTLITRLTTDKNGYANSGNILNYGSYYVQEISPSSGYKINSTKYPFELNSSSSSVDVSFIVPEEVIKGRIKILKVDKETNACKQQGESSLVGAQYNIIDSKGKIVETLVIGSDCSATSKLLPYDTYTIKELKASTGYKLDQNIYTIKINEEKSYDIVSKENVIKGRIQITKNDNDNKSCVALGQATLVGARYNITDLNNNIVDTITIGNDCTGISKLLPYGRYKIKEISPSNGYLLDKSVYNVNIVDEVDYNIKSYEEVVKNYISILKQYKFVDGNTTFLNAESGITFEIYYPDGTLYDTITTDKNGYATIEIPYGIWKFHQVNTTTGYTKIYDFNIVVDYNSSKQHYYNILNNALSAYVQVFKTDSETGKTIAIADTTFKILNTDTKQYVSQFVGGKIYNEFKTDETGKFVTYLALESGNYKLIEVNNPHGYLLDRDGLEFTIGKDTYYNYTTYGAFVTFYFKNAPIKGQIEINKKGDSFVIDDGSFDYELIPLEDVKYEIHAKEDIKSADGNYIYFNKGDLVDTLTTDKFGYAISKLLPLGKYIIVEVATKPEYVLNTKEYTIELTEEDNKTEVVYETHRDVNYLKKGTLEFTKTDISTSDPIPNTLIEIYTENDELIFTGKTDKDGKINIANLKVGKYYLIEKEPATGYVITDKKVYFEIKKNKEIVKAEMKNKPITGTLEFTKTDISTSDPIPNTLIEIYNANTNDLIFSGKTDEKGKIIIPELRYGKYYLIEKEPATGYVITDKKVYFEIKENKEIVKAEMKNKPITGTLEFTKTDISTGNPLPNTLIEIYNADTNDLIFSGKTDEKGKIIISELRYGKYYLIEKEAPISYIINDEKMYFEVKKDGEIIKSNMVNEKIKSIIKIHKVDEENKPLEGVKIGIYDLNGNEVYVGVTDKDGIIEVELEYGSYYYMELDTKEGYQLSEEKTYFDVLNDDEIIDSTLINIKVPNTSLSDSKVLNIITIILVVSGIGYIIYDKSKKK